jgi:MFS family permease
MSTEATKISADTLPENGIALEAKGEPWPSPARAWYAVIVFALALMINFLDRGIISLLVRPIKESLSLSDFQMSLVMGFAFACFYVILGFPIARMADYKNRRTILCVGVAIWSVMTAVCGLAQNFWQLFLCRVGVGSGEACSGPSTYSMLADLFPRDKLPRAIAVLNFGFYAGNGLAYMIGGAITQMFDSTSVTLPIIGVTMNGWRLVFVVVGLPGLIVAAMLMTVREPKRRGLVSANTNDSMKPLPIKEVVAFIRENRATYAPMFIGMGIQVVMTIGAASWAYTFYDRIFKWSAGKFGLVMGLLSFTIMPIGTLLGSMLAERFARSGRDDANLRVVLIGKILAIPFGVLFPFMPTLFLAVTVSTISLFFISLTPAPLNAAFQIITPNQMRGQVTAIYMFVFNVIGVGLGPTIVAVFTNYVFRDEQLIGYSLALTGLILGPLGTIAIWRAMKPYGRSVAEAKAWS